mmetsp:Transcript_78469/g.233772  ORF Transcript_78469/g.233772 Transcript_78469/m.233772 type:complete len:264 (+) Transcript_78469:1196-1987(+)
MTCWCSRGWSTTSLNSAPWGARKRSSRSDQIQASCIGPLRLVIRTSEGRPRRLFSCSRSSIAISLMRYTPPMAMTTDPMARARFCGELYTAAIQLKTMSAVALMAASVCCRFSCISTRIARMFTSSFSRAALIFAACSTLAFSIASCTPISARLSSDCRRRSNSSFSPCRLCSSCLMFDSSCFCISSKSAALFCAVSWATRSWCSLELWSSLLRCSSARRLIVFCSSSQRSFSMLRLMSATSTSASAALRFSTRSARASRSTA